MGQSASAESKGGQRHSRARCRDSVPPWRRLGGSPAAHSPGHHRSPALTQSMDSQQFPSWAPHLPPPSPSCLCLCFPLSRKVSLGSASELGLEVCSEGREEIPTLGPVATHNTHSSDLGPCPPHCACKMMPSWTAVPIAFGTTPFLG